MMSNLICDLYAYIYAWTYCTKKNRTVCECNVKLLVMIIISTPAPSTFLFSVIYMINYHSDVERHNHLVSKP